MLRSDLYGRYVGGCEMGEAKNRKLKDPMFGKLPNRKLPRGIVLTSPMEIEGSTLRMNGANLHPEELRFALLYWDKLSWPNQSFIVSDMSEDEKLLAEMGVLERPEFDFNGDVAQGMLKGYLGVFKEKAQSSPGLWSLSEGERSLSAICGRDEFDTVDSLSVRLARSIPIPGVDMSVEQIIKFKEKRRDELGELRACLENTTQDMNFMGNPDEYLNHQINKMRDACANLLRVSGEWQSPFYLSDVSLSTSETLAGLGLAGLSLKEAFEVGGSVTGAMVMGALSGVVSVGLTPKLRWVKKDLGPYKYVYKMHKELV